MIDDIVTYLRGLDIDDLGTKVFRQTIPANQEVAVGVYSPLTGVKIDQELPKYHKDSLQIIARAKTYADAEAIAQAVSDALTIYNQQVGDTYIKHLRPRHLPAVYPRSSGDFYEGSVNFDFCFVRA